MVSADIARLPYGPTFRFVEEVLAADLHAPSIRTAFFYDKFHPLVAEHLVGGLRIVPGVLLIEQICQSALLLGMLGGWVSSPTRARLSEVSARFHAPAPAPCRIVTDIRLSAAEAGATMVAGTAFIGQHAIAEVQARATSLGDLGCSMPT